MTELPPIICIDFEGHPDYGIIEFGVVRYFRGQIEETVTRLCSSLGDVKDSEVHGLYEKDLCDCEPFANEYNRFLEWREEGVFCAHNAGFEHRLLRTVWPYPSMVFNPLSREGELCANWGPWFDTLKLARCVYPHLQSYKLMNIINALGLNDDLNRVAQTYCPESRRFPHCALFDALASALILNYCLNDPDYDDLNAIQWLRMSQGGDWSQGELF